ncbi:regulator of PEP synthase PpsR (kinase-PPPase family) [Peptoniphilus ivorii]|uniref:pyruvate, water dikinase regulatory protein n=1 Tax=Aedoeadaptatus ivorii TaxID=54006 RepID=UPI00278755D4|nr:pyruvate, water dikinase regulatory protein [Peptoniphilus ivorii]MDQ0507612.1 regulator of PEP synthase PpsR (kinase-PPPase family) [Peptoniphilus ivorii]
MKSNYNMEGARDDQPLFIYVISDSIGETGELIAKASVRQFDTKDFLIKRYPYHNSVEQIGPLLEEAAEHENTLIVYTNVDEKTRAYIKCKEKELHLNTVDVMGPPMDRIEDILGYAPIREPGLIRRLDENYFKKVEAIEFAVQYDDGKDPRGIVKADICLVGVSRTSKTPLSMYLANKLYKVANVPLVPEVPVPKEVYEKDNRRLFGLVANSQKLYTIREERLRALGLNSSAKYANVDRIEEEVDYSVRVMKEIGCTIIDVSNKAIEETAEIINDYMVNRF